MEKKEWFAEWFDSSYYHILYKHRDHAEAERFINNLTSFLGIPKGSHVLDLACGKGRHALTLNQLGYSVVGADLSPESIKEASQYSNDQLRFLVHDMRRVIPEERFSAVFNLFTSFGYFDDQQDNQSVLESIHRMLEQKGILVIDFMNASKVIEQLVKKEEKITDGICFQLERHYDGQHIFKNIRFVDEGKEFHYTERVQALKKADFEKLLQQSGFNILHTFGNFDLDPFDEEHSDRLILIAQRN